MGSEIVGRREELEAIERFLHEEPGHARVLALEGEAGSGKTTLWRFGLERARERGLRTLAARPAEAETKLSFSALGDLLAGALEEVLPALPQPQRRALGVALLLETSRGANADPRTVGLSVLNALRSLSSEEPLLVAIDDVQWLDAASAGALAYALRRLDAEPVALLFARRATERKLKPVKLLDDEWLPPRVQVLPVGPLTLGATHELLSDRLGVAFPRPLMRRLHELAGGNAFFALELGRALSELEGRVDPGQPLPVPDEVLALVAGRLARLPSRTQEALRVAAASSQPTLDLIGAAVGGDASALLEPAVAARIVDVADQRVRFTHPLLASAASGGGSPASRRSLHRRLASLVPDFEERAHHLALGAEAPDEAVAATLEEASRRAAARGAPGAAAELCAQSRLLTPPEHTEAIHRRRLHEAEYAMQSGDTPRARVVLEEVLAASPSGRARAEALTYLARVHFNGLDWRASVELLDRALGEAGDDVALRAQIELHLAVSLDLLRTDVAATLEHAEAAAGLATELGDEAVLAEALALEAKNEFLLGRAWPEATVARALALEPATAALAPDRRPSDYVAAMTAWTDDLDAALRGFELVRTAALEQGDEVSLVWTLVRMAEVECRAGRWAEAIDLIERGHEIALQAGQRANQAIFLAARALVEAHLGSEESAREVGERAVRLAEETGAVMARRTALAALGFLELSLGRAGEADSHLGHLTAETRRAGVGEPGAMRFVPDEVEALVALGRLEEADGLLAFVEERGRATGRASALAAGARCRALLRAARGELDAALAALAEALERYGRLPLPFERARTLTVLGQVQRRAREKTAARATLEEARAAFEALGAAIWAERARSELARIGGRAPRRGELTPTERRVADLVAEGLSNKSIAAALFVTPKTVEGTLSRVYTKLGVRSRTELARRLTRTDQAGKV